MAFAPLGEEYRRSGNFGDAISMCRAGLAMHPGYLSARVTLGRALFATGDLEGAEVELARVLRRAPQNVAALRGMGDINVRRGRLTEALKFYRAALVLARHDRHLEQTAEDIERSLGAGSLVQRELGQLERFLGAIHTYRHRSAV